MKLNRSEMIEAGWSDDSRLDDIMSYAQQLATDKGIKDKKYMHKLLRREFPDAYAHLRMCRAGEECPLTEAIEASTLEEEKSLRKVRQQMLEQLRSPVVQYGSLMPDACPVGGDLASMPVGSVIVTDGAIIPAAHSADICCSMFASFYFSELSLENELEHLQQSTRFGPGVRDVAVEHSVLDEDVWMNPFLKGLQAKAKFHMADQGDGNHFAYLGEMEVTTDLLDTLDATGYKEMYEAFQGVEGRVRVLVTHHGSRGLGASVYQRGLDAAKKQTRKYARDIPEESTWLYYDSVDGAAYWQALQYVARWTKANHQSIHQRFLERIESKCIYELGNEHNFVWKRGNSFYHGKGATPAWKDKDCRPLLGLIPLNMAEPILMVLGGDNQKFASFAPHGAGRNISRRAYLKKYKRRNGPEKGTLDTKAISRDIAQTTQHIQVRWYLGEPDLTETPMGYKSADEIIRQTKKYDLARVIAQITPRGCIMAGRKPKQAERPLTPKQIRQQQQRSSRRKEKQLDWQQERSDEWI